MAEVSSDTHPSMNLVTAHMGVIFTAKSDIAGTLRLRVYVQDGSNESFAVKSALNFVLLEKRKPFIPTPDCPVLVAIA